MVVAVKGRGGDGAGVGEEAALVIRGCLSYAEWQYKLIFVYVSVSDGLVLLR